MYQGQNPFIAAAVQHFQTVLGESGRAVTISQSLLAACDEIVMAAQAGNMQGALAAAQNARNMAAQLTSSTRMLNQAVIQHFDRSSFVMGKIQHRVNEVATALQHVRTGLGTGPAAYADPRRMPWHGVTPWQYGAARQTPQTPLM